MPSTSNPASYADVAGDSEQPDVEARMRRALGIEAGSHAISRDGSVVVVEHRGGRNPRPQINRVALAEDTLAAERQAREKAERLVRDLKASLLEAETKCKHTELALDEARAALGAERGAREAAERDARQAVERSERLTSEHAAAIAIVRKPAPARAAEASAPEVEDVPIVKKRRGRPPRSASTDAPRPAEPEDDAQPVEWWVPGWRSRSE
jgi:hypothetical protein